MGLWGIYNGYDSKRSAGWQLFEYLRCFIQMFSPELLGLILSSMLLISASVISFSDFLTLSKTVIRSLIRVIAPATNPKPKNSIALLYS